MTDAICLVEYSVSAVVASVCLRDFIKILKIFHFKFYQAVGIFVSENNIMIKSTFILRVYLYNVEAVSGVGR